jgi:nucleotide-binding universal stress UspA family protein
VFNRLLYEKNVLIPIDGRENSMDVVEFFCMIQNTTNFVIHVVYVIEVPRNLPLDTELPEQYEKAQDSLLKAVKISEKYNTLINTSVIYSRTMEDSILTTAQNLKCELIAIHQDAQRLRIFGNIASNISQRAKCSVWIFNNKTQSHR